MVYRPIVSATLLLTGGVLMAQQNKPNVVFILADDLGYGDISPYGQKLIYRKWLRSECVLQTSMQDVL